jgi:hypothetical protein
MDGQEAPADGAKAARRRRGRAALALAAFIVSLLGLGGPVMLATTGDASGVLPWYPLGWAAAILSFLYWLRTR